MELVHVVVDALIAGAALRQNAIDAPAVIDAYTTQKLRLASAYAAVDLARIEAKPDSERGRAYLVEDLQESGALHDPAILAAVVGLLEALSGRSDAAEMARTIGVDLEQVRAASLKLIDIVGDDVAVRLHNSEFRDGIEIRTAQGGQAPAKSGAPTYILTSNQAGKIVFGSDEQPDFAALEQHYLHGLYVECNDLPLANDGPVDATRPRQPRLQHVYVDLATTVGPSFAQVIARLPLSPTQRLQFEHEFTRSKQQLDAQAAAQIGRSPDAVNAGIPDSLFTQLEKKYELPKDAFKIAIKGRLTVLEAIRDHPQLVLLGDPGGGKSTLTRRLAGVLASRTVTTNEATEAQWLTDLTQLWGRWLLPVRIVLSRWAQQLAPDTQGTADDLIDECVRLLGQTAEVRGLKEHLMTRLAADPPTALILLDGLDEVTDETKRTTLLKAVKHFSERYRAVPLIVTCRSRPWQAWSNAGLALPLPDFTIDKLTSDAITAFVERWHAELVWAGRYTVDAAAAAQRRLLNAIANPTRKDLADMARTPLLLTMMARVNYERGLPDSRAELYEVYLRQLLWEWERSKLDERGQLTSLQQLLNQPTPRVPANNLELSLCKLAFDVHASRGHRDTVDIGESDLRKALEAIHPGNRRERAAWAVAVLDLIHERSGLLKSLDADTFQFTHRTFQEYLAARHLATGDTTTVLEKFRAKIDHEQWREAIRLALGYQIAVQSQYDTALAILEELLPDAPQAPTEWQRVLLLGEVYVRLLGPQSARLAQQRKRAERLRCQIPALLTATMQERTLPPRQRLEAGQLLALLDTDPPGLNEFVTAAHWSFEMARYPVTNKQFRRFVETGGYRDDRWWSEGGRVYRHSRGWTHPGSWNVPQFTLPTQPVVGVSWYEAQAYCTWLTYELYRSGDITKEQQVRLPTETEWELAACSSKDISYPWGKKFDENNANTKANGLSQTTFVHMYPGGTTSEGIWDVIGNMWEWTNDVDTKGIVCLKGGSWRDEPDWLSPATSVKTPIDVRHSHVGFRCLIAPKSQ